VHRLLLSPLADSDPAELRRLGRALRAQERERDPATRPAASATLVRLLVEEVAADPDAVVLPLAPSSSGPHARARHALAAVVRLARLVHAGRSAVARSASAEEVLWAVWSGAARGAGWPQRLEAAALRGGDAGRRADADLDAVLALFAAARRVEERYSGRRGVENFLAELEAQEIPADTLAERGLRGPAVRILTAHRAKGLQWRLVVVASVQEGLWPDLRRRGSLLQADRLEVTGLVAAPPPAALLAEERRLFYVACTRAEERLVVTAVRSPLDDGAQPSRFVDEVRGFPVGPTDRSAASGHVAGRPPRPLSVPGLVARLRATAVDPSRPAALRAAAVRRLAVLAHATDDDGRPLVAAAHPDRWWGLNDPTSAPVPVRPDDRALDLSGSQLSALVGCPLRWFLDHEVHAQVARSTALGFGSIVHVLADAVAREELPADPDLLDARIDEVWADLGFEALWQSRAERTAASEAVHRFLHWHLSRDDRTFVASEHPFEVTVPVGEQGVRLRGSFDRVEVDADGAVHIADLKTQRSAVARDELARHPQMGVYQLSVRAGALDSLPESVRERVGLGPAGEPPVVAGAELVLLRLGKGDSPQVQTQEPLGDGATWVDVALADAEGAVRAETFPARPGTSSCRGCGVRVACPAYDEGREVLP
jgi:RecB family exonuclease